MRLVSGFLAALATLVGCDSKKIEQLEEGVATEADVKAQFGQPENVWDEPGGARTLEYNRNPAGNRNYMITIGPDGKMTALRQVLTPDTFAKVQPGMPMEQVRRMLGKPARQQSCRSSASRPGTGAGWSRPTPRWCSRSGSTAT
jgi:hypothetical protein